jgi:hypothetical protein
MTEERIVQSMRSRSFSQAAENHQDFVRVRLSAGRAMRARQSVSLSHWPDSNQVISHSGGNRMQLSSWKKALCVALSVVLTLGSPVFAGGPVEIRSTDIALGHGQLTGCVLNVAGQPVSGIPVQVLHGESVIATVASNEDGQFAVEGLRNGAHVIQVGSSVQPVRFWSAHAAPPAAAGQLAIVVDEEIVRGQCGDACGDPCGEACGAGTKCCNGLGLLLFGGAVAATLVYTLDQNGSDAPASP